MEENDAALEAQLMQLEVAVEADTPLRNQLHELIGRTRTHLESMRSHRRASASFVQVLETGAKELENLRTTLSETAASVASVSNDENLALQKLSIAELEQRLALQQTDLAAAKSRLAEHERWLREAPSRIATARQSMAEIRQILQELETERRIPPTASDPSELVEARRLLLLARQRHREAELERLEHELASFPLRNQLTSMRRDLAALEVSLAESRVQWAQQALSDMRRMQAAQALHEAASTEQALADGHPLVRAMAERNAELSSKLALLTHDLEAVIQEREAIERKAQNLEADFAHTQQKLEIAGLSVVLGRILLEQRDALPDIRAYRAAAASRKHLISRIGLEDLIAADERRQMGSVTQRLEAIMAQASERGEAKTLQASLENELKPLLSAQYEILQRLSDTRSTYLRALTELDFAERALIERASVYADFLAEHLLWVPSHTAWSWSLSGALFEATYWLFTPTQWAQALDHLGLEIWAQPHISLLALALALPLFWLRPRMQAHMEEVAAKVGRVHLDRFSHTPIAMLLTVLIVLPEPLLLGAAGWLMYSALDPDPFTQSLGYGLLWAAPIWFNLALFLRMCNTRGVATRHFLWNESSLSILRSELKQLLRIGVPAVFVAATLGYYAPEIYTASLGRIAFVIAMLAFAWFMEGLLRPRGGAASHAYAKQTNWVVRLRHIWYMLGIGIPITLAILALIGYYHTATELSLRMINTFWLVVVGLFVHDLTLRWLTLTRRRVAFQQALERREAARAAKARQGGEQSSEEPEVPLPETRAIDLDLVDEKTRRLLRAGLYLLAVGGLWMIWSDILPALSFLDAVHLWMHSSTVGHEVIVKPITLADFLLAAVFGVAALVLGRNLPALLEIILLQRTRLEAGSRYAITHLMQYAIALLGLGLVFSTLGFTWSKIQWLAAALTVGLGFGLQEIFGNFVSGLIILFERPVRVGDTVTVGDLSGRITRIQIRATTITDWDRKEIIVPNKELITQRVINWTLSDPITRVQLRVYVAYGSDTKLTHQTILDAVRATSLVRNDPEPRVYFAGFGDSSLQFDVYAFASELADRLPLLHELHMTIERALREQGLEIPFPQRDVHVSFVHPPKTQPGLEI